LHGPEQEVFAEEYAVQTAFYDLPDSQQQGAFPTTGSDQAFYLSQSLVCTQAYVQSLSRTGKAPTATALSQIGTLEPLTFEGDKYGVIYGPPNQNTNPMVSDPWAGAPVFEFHKCDGTTALTGNYSFGL
jgi:hypothetical protein